MFFLLKLMTNSFSCPDNSHLRQGGIIVFVQYLELRLPCVGIAVKSE